MTMAFARPTILLLASLYGLQIARGAEITISMPDITSSYHAGDLMPVQWLYEGVGQEFSILLLKGGIEVADLCALEEDGVCFDLTQDQTVLLPEILESGADYTVHVKDQSSDAEHVSEEFIVLGTTSSNLEVISPNGTVSLTAGSKVSVEWLYVGVNQLFDIYLRQGGERVSENLCSMQTDGSCRSTGIGSATVTLPSGIEDGSNYKFLVVDKNDDDSWGLSPTLPVGEVLSIASTESSVGMKIGLVIGLCAGGVCLLALMLGCMRTKNKQERRQKQMATLDAPNKRRPAPSVPLSVEGIAGPCESPDQSDAGDINAERDAARTFMNPMLSTSQNFYEGQITPPNGDSVMWRRSRDLSNFVVREIRKSFSRSQSNINND